jgi:transcriptional regulator with XRE-family HTH domain
MPTTRGASIKAYRERAGKRQRDVAEHLDVTVQTVSGWERDVYDPSTANVERLAAYLGVQPSQLLKNVKGGAEFDPPPPPAPAPRLPAPTDSILGGPLGDALPALLRAAFEAGASAQTTERAEDLLRELTEEAKEPPDPSIGVPGEASCFSDFGQYFGDTGENKLSNFSFSRTPQFRFRSRPHKARRPRPCTVPCLFEPFGPDGAAPSGDISRQPGSDRVIPALVERIRARGDEPNFRASATPEAFPVHGGDEPCQRGPADHVAVAVARPPHSCRVACAFVRVRAVLPPRSSVWGVAVRGHVPRGLGG